MLAAASWYRNAKDLQRLLFPKVSSNSIKIQSAACSSAQWPCSSRLRTTDEADWIYSPEWWGSHDGGFGIDRGRTVFEALSTKGNGVVSVTSHSASFPNPEEWPALEFQLQQKFERVSGGSNSRVKIQGFQWQVLRFNNVTRESVAKVMAVYIDRKPSQIFLKQQPHCLGFPYVKSMLITGLTALSSTKFDLKGAISGLQKMRILCIGNGGGTIPLFLASSIKGALVDVVEIDEAVISASIQYMGFPGVFNLDCKSPSLFQRYKLTEAYTNELWHSMQKVLWDDIQERIFLYEADGEAFICNSVEDTSKEKGSPFYDMVFVDAYDGDDIFPHKFRDRHGSFLKALQSKLHPRHGTVVVNLHEDTSPENGLTGKFAPLGIRNLKVAEMYRDTLACSGSQEFQENADNLAFTVAAPALANVSLVVGRGFVLTDTYRYKKGYNNMSKPSVAVTEEQVFQKLLLESYRVQNLFTFPFDCSLYLQRRLFIL